MLQQTVTIAELPVIADVEATTRAVSLMRVERVGDRLVGEGPICALTLDNSSGLVKTELPDAFRRALPAVRIDAALSWRDGTLIYRQEPRTLVVGARLGVGEPLPTSPTDKRVFDQDGDGKPGVTVRVSGLVSGDIYLVQRSTSRLFGALRGEAFTGRIDFQNEQRVLATTNVLLGDGPASRPVAERSFFRLQRVKTGSTCEQARALAGRWR